MSERPRTLLDLLKRWRSPPVADDEHDCGAPGCVLRGLRPAEIEALRRRFDLPLTVRGTGCAALPGAVN